MVIYIQIFFKQYYLLFQLKLPLAATPSAMYFLESARLRERHAFADGSTSVKVSVPPEAAFKDSTVAITATLVLLVTVMSGAVKVSASGLMAYATLIGWVT